MKKKKNKFYHRILLVASLVGLIVLGCAKRPPLEDIGNRLSYPSLLWSLDFESNNDSKYFLLLNTNALSDYKSGNAILFEEKNAKSLKKKSYIRDFPANLFPVSVAQSKFKVNNKNVNLVAIGFAGRNPSIRFYNFKEDKNFDFIEQLVPVDDSEYCDTSDCKFWGSNVNKSIDQMGFFTIKDSSGDTDKDRNFFYYTINPQSSISRIRIHEVQNNGIMFPPEKKVIKIPEDLDKPEDFYKNKENYVLSYASPSLIEDDIKNQYFVFLPQGVSGDDPPDLPDPYEYMKNQNSDDKARRASLGIVSLKKLFEENENLYESTKYLPLAWDKNGLAYSDSNKDKVDKDSFSFKKKFWTSYAISDAKSEGYEEKGQKDLLIVQKEDGSRASDILKISGFNNDIFNEREPRVVPYTKSNMSISLYSKARDNKTLDNTPNAINTMSMLKIDENKYLPFWVRRFSNTTYETFGLGKSWLGLNVFESGKLNTNPILYSFEEDGPESCTVLDDRIYCINFGNSHLRRYKFDKNKKSFDPIPIEVE